MMEFVFAFARTAPSGLDIWSSEDSALLRLRRPRVEPSVVCCRNGHSKKQQASLVKGHVRDSAGDHALRQQHSESAPCFPHQSNSEGGNAEPVAPRDEMFFHGCFSSSWSLARADREGYCRKVRFWEARSQHRESNLRMPSHS